MLRYEGFEVGVEVMMTCDFLKEDCLGSYLYTCEDLLFVLYP